MQLAIDLIVCLMELLQDYMLNGQILNGQILNGQILNINIDNKKKGRDKGNSTNNSTNNSKDIFFYPDHVDQLFWCFYIIKNGFASYEYPGNTSFTNEKSEKFKCIELLREKKSILKDKKIKNVKEDIEDELANKERIGMKTFIALCAVNNINILYIHNKKCFDNSVNAGDSIVHVVHSLPYHKYCYESEVSTEKITDYRTNYFNWENIDKPLRAVSYYTLDELLVLCKNSLVSAIDDKKKTKKDLYEMLVTYLQ